MSDIFDAYDGELKETYVKVNNLLDTGNASDDTNIKQHIAECTDLLKQMNIEIRQIPIADRKNCQERLVSLQGELIVIKSKYERYKDMNQRSNLIGTKSDQDRQKVLNLNEKLSRQNDAILNAQRVVSETEEVGIETMKELQSNREKIVGAQTKADEVNVYINSAQKITKSMESRDKCIIS